MAQETTEEVDNEIELKELDVQATDETTTKQPEEKTETVDQSEKVATDEESDDKNEVEDIEIEIEGETPDPDQENDKTPLIKKLRTQLKEQGKELRTFRDDRKSRETAKADLVLGPKPKLHDVDILEDEAVYDDKMEQWLSKKARIESKKSEEQATVTKETEDWKQVVSSYENKKKAFKVPDFESAEDIVRESLSTVQQGIIISATDSPEVVIYALSQPKNASLLDRLSKIKDPVKFAVQMGKLESNMKVKPRKPTTQPERIVTGKHEKNSGADAEMAKLEKEADADPNGDRTKIQNLLRKRRDLARAS